MKLKSIPNNVLRPLHQLIRLPIDMNDSQKITSEHYAPFTPQIKLFLAKNELVSLPPELWNLGNLTVLSMRNNELATLSPSINRLRNLQELNIAGNQFNWLPWELLDLLLPENRKLQRVSLSPNPFLQPLGERPPPTLSRFRVPVTARECAVKARKLRTRFPNATQSDSAYESLLLRLHETRLHQIVSRTQSGSCVLDVDSDEYTTDDNRPIYVASSKTTFLDFDGSKLRTPMSSFSSQPSEDDYTASLTPTSLPVKSVSAAPSLFELSARSCARSPYINQLSSLLPDDASPPVTRALERVTESKEVGLEACSVCRKSYVIPRAQWVEYWFDGHGSGEQFLPFMRSACSWKCVQRLANDRADELASVHNVATQYEAQVGEGVREDELEV